MGIAVLVVVLAVGELVVAGDEQEVSPKLASTLAGTELYLGMGAPVPSAQKPSSAAQSAREC